MTLLSISLLVFSITILFITILVVIWWRKFGKSLFSTFKSLTNMQNPQDMMEKFKKMGNFTDMYKNMSNFNQRISDIAKKMTKNK